MKQTIMAVAVLVTMVAAVSCEKEIIVSDDTKGMVFTATIDNEVDTKTTLASGNAVQWADGDQITINGSIFNAQFKDNDYSKAYFSLADGKTAPEGNSYVAFYPASIYDSTNKKYVFPSVQSYNGGNKISNALMYAYSTTTSLPFKNICAVLAITVKSSEMTEVKNIVVTSNAILNGNFTLGDNYSFIFENSDDSSRKTITLNCNDLAISTDKDTTFYIAIPAGTHKLTIQFNGNHSSEDGKERSMSSAQTFERNKIYKINYSKS